MTIFDAKKTFWGAQHFSPLRMYLLEEELVWAKRGLEQIVSALDDNQNNVKILKFCDYFEFFL